LIGVIPKEGQTQVVQEFFELFKTPWEFYKPGRRYDVVVATADDLPEIDARLLLAYGCQSKNTDARHGTVVHSRLRGARLPYQQTGLPVYGELATFGQGDSSVPCITTSAGVVGLRNVSATGGVAIRLGYDLFQEVEFLLMQGQPVEYAQIPTLDLHIQMLRNWILNEDIPLLELRPVPQGYSFTVCLTHDIDFVGIRNHKFDHTMWGFLFRSTVGAAWKYLNRRISINRLLKCWRAAASLPFVFLGWVEDFWDPFDWYLRVERGLGATYFLIPFKQRSGERVPGRYAFRRAAPYEVAELTQQTGTLQQQGCELGVHGIDAWHSAEKGRIESAKIAKNVNRPPTGIRMHWLLQDSETPRILDESGYAYDSTAGYNETIGYRNGTSQVFRPLVASRLLELPLHIQDGALFYPHNLNLTESEAAKRCKSLLGNAHELGGVLTLLWHDRSHAAERFWGEFYLKLIQTLKSSGVWFATCAQAVEWFRKRRKVGLEYRETADGAVTSVSYQGETPVPSFTLRVYRRATANYEGQLSSDVAITYVDFPWNGETKMEFDSKLNKIPEVRAEPPAVTL